MSTGTQEGGLETEPRGKRAGPAGGGGSKEGGYADLGLVDGNPLEDLDLINDLGTIGGGDAVFDASGRLHALPVFAGFVSYRHTWSERLKLMSDWSGLLRSNFTVSWVDVDTYRFQPDDAYSSTLRAPANLIYFPTQNVKLGVELLWGERVNQGQVEGQSDSGADLARYSF